MALSKTALPSVPFNPTAPPIPATGFTMNPTIFVGKLFWGTVNLNNAQVGIGLLEQKEKDVYLQVIFAACKSLDLHEKISKKD
jgi:hypothetical protein